MSAPFPLSSLNPIPLRQYLNGQSNSAGPINNPPPAFLAMRIAMKIPPYWIVLQAISSMVVFFGRAS